MVPLNKYSKAAFLPNAIIFFFYMANLAFAETKVFLEEYTYQASEADSKLSSRVIALEQVKRLLLEKLGIYLESETEVKNFQLTKDQIVILTAGVVSVEITEEKWDGKTYYLKAKIAADPKDIVNSIDKLRQERHKTKILEETRKKADEAFKEVEKLRKELEIAKAGKTEQDQYNKAVNRLSATTWLYKGAASGMSGEHQEAIEEFSKAIELNPLDATAYCLRGLAYIYLGSFSQAIKDLDKAIQLNPNYALAYSDRGYAYLGLGDYQQAIRDCSRAIQLDPLDANAYNNRGVAYGSIKDNRQAIRDHDKAIELDPKSALAYRNRGISYRKLEDYQRAIRDYGKAIELNPNFAEAYFSRGLAYRKLGDYRQALEDLTFAARLGFEPAQKFLESEGISW